MQVLGFSDSLSDGALNADRWRGGDEPARPEPGRPASPSPSLNYHPHLHVLATDGVFLEDGQFYGYLDWDAHELTARLRDSVLASFTRLGLLEEDTARTMLAWPVERSGFHVHVESAIPEEAREQLRTVLRYLTRAPAEPEVEDSQVPPAWEDWDPA